MARNDFEVAFFMKRKGDQTASVSCDEVFSALFQIPWIAFVERSKAAFFKERFCVCDGVKRGEGSFQKCK